MFFGSPKPVACGGPVPGLLAAALLGLAALIGCAPRGPAPVRGKPLVVATTTIVADLVRQVAGDRVTIDCLMGDGIDPHSYKATPRDADRLRAADLVVASGLHLEGKLADLLEKLADRVPVVAVADSLPRDQLLDAGAGFHDPHVWFDARLWSGCIPAVEKALVAIDPAGAAEYGQRADAHRRELEAADEAVRRTIAAIPPSRRVLVTAHDAFHYFGRAYGVEVQAVQGVSTESEAGVQEINRLVDFLSSRKIKAVFVEASVSDRNIKALIEGCTSRGHAVTIGGELYSDSMGPVGTEVGTYVGMVRHNVDLIVRALQ